MIGRNLEQGVQHTEDLLGWIAWADEDITTVLNMFAAVHHAVRKRHAKTEATH